ncbi:MAG: tRNA pseudouridine(38-40) synthase TruA [Acidobacteriota bacterium]|nr:tRNA pseudouridine(38-40) synthase TruA [Acidobacteriota bacterium]
MRTLKLTLAYDGGDFVGWQRQPVGRSIQGELEQAFEEIEGQRIDVQGAGRTDAGVHALAQVASVRLAHGIETHSLARALNAKLPLDIRVLSVEHVQDQFHARFSSRRKIYRYFIAPGPVVSPFVRRYAWHVVEPLDVTAMNKAAVSFLGQHDFEAFQAVGSDVETTVRTISEVTLGTRQLAGVESTDGLISVDIIGDGFLRHMVRIMVGTLVSVGRGQQPVRAINDVIRSGERECAGITAPAHGLFLVTVKY